MRRDQCCYGSAYAHQDGRQVLSRVLPMLPPAGVRMMGKLEQVPICSERATRGLSKSTKALIAYAYGLLELDHPQTLRQLHYAIFSRRAIAYENTPADYHRLSRATTTARRKYRRWELCLGSGPGSDMADALSLIPPEWMVDETRQIEITSVWQDAPAYIDAVRRSYRRDNWQTQPSYVEVWSEKGTVLASLRPITQKWGIGIRVCHGFGSTGMEGDVGETFAEVAAQGKQITVFYVGDHDPSGHSIEEDIHRRSQNASGIEFQIQRLAIHAEDIRKFNLPPQKIKASDSRAAGFKERFGSNAATVELDALPVGELKRRVEAAVSGLIDAEHWNRQIRVQEVELKCIQDFAERFRNLPRSGGTE